MSVQSEILRLKTNVINAFAAVAEKGGTVEDGANSDNLADSILSIPAGGGAELNFEIVGGTTQPENPVENTIWVNTETEITGWVFSSEEPENSAPGRVWIETKKESAYAFNALQENVIQVYPVASMQYVDGSWIDVPSMIYQSGAWVDLLDGSLFANGDQYEKKTGGWSRTGYSLSGFNHTNISKNMVGGNIQVQAISGGSSDSGGLVGTANLIDISKFTQMRVKGKVDTYKSNTRLYIGVNNTKKITSTPLAYIRLTASGEFEKTLDLPADVDEAYVFVLAGCLTGVSSQFTSTLFVSEIVLL